MKKIIPTLAALLTILVTARLGLWQLDRAHEREAKAARRSALAVKQPILLTGGLPDNFVELIDSPATVEGVWAKDKAVWLDNQVYQGQVGYQVIMPMRISGSHMHVLVNRGWIKATNNRRKLPVFHTAEKVDMVKGILHERTPRVASVGKQGRDGVLWSEVIPKSYSSWSGLAVYPVILYQVNEARDGLIRDWPEPDSGADRNRGYAIQWFALAITAFIFWIYYLFRRMRVADNT